MTPESFLGMALIFVGCTTILEAVLKIVVLRRVSAREALRRVVGSLQKENHRLREELTRVSQLYLGAARDLKRKGRWIERAAVLFPHQAETVDRELETAVDGIGPQNRPVA